MQDSHIYRTLTEIFREVFDDDTIVLTPETTAADIPGWDSMAHVGLMVAIESRMNVRFKSSELEAMHNVGQLVGVLEYKMESQAKPK